MEGATEELRQGSLCDTRTTRAYPGQVKHSTAWDSDAAEAKDLPSLCLPWRMHSDVLFNEIDRPQVEFVVDNQTIAELMNLEARIVNDHYRPVINRVRGKFADIFTSFDYKASYFPPLDWRPREYNSPPDVICNWIINDSTARE